MVHVVAGSVGSCTWAIQTPPGSFRDPFKIGSDRNRSATVWAIRPRWLLTQGLSVGGLGLGSLCSGPGALVHGRHECHLPQVGPLAWTGVEVGDGGVVVGCSHGDHAGDREHGGCDLPRPPAAGVLGDARVRVPAAYGGGPVSRARAWSFGLNATLWDFLEGRRNPTVGLLRPFRMRTNIKVIQWPVSAP